MKYKAVIILIVFVGVSAFNITKTFEFNNPSVKIEYINGEKLSKGDVAVFSIKLCSVENLKSFKVIPEIPGQNEDSELFFDFDENTKQATLNYIYIVPELLKEKMSFTFILKDKKSVTEKIENLIII